MKPTSSIQLIRNATVLFSYGGQKFLIDPMLAPKGTYPGLEGTANSHLRNPLVELPVEPETLFDVDAILLTHLHPDHWDPVAAEILPKDKPVFTQNNEDAEIILASGFSDVRIMTDRTVFNNVVFSRTVCQHGSDQAYAIPEVAAVLGQASGLYFSHEGEKSVYFIGDSIWIDDVENTLKNNKPDVVVVNAGFAELPGLGGIIFGKEDVSKVNEVLPDATIVTIHMEAVNHCMLSRTELQQYVNEKGIASKVIIPSDGQVINL